MDGTLEREGEGSLSKAPQPELAKSAEKPAIKDAKQYTPLTNPLSPFYTHHDCALHCVLCSLIRLHEIYIFLSCQWACQTLVCAEVCTTVFLSISFQAVCRMNWSMFYTLFALFLLYTYSWSTYFPQVSNNIFSASTLNLSVIKEHLMINVWSERQCKSVSTRQMQLTACTYHSAFYYNSFPPFPLPLFTIPCPGSELATLFISGLMHPFPNLTGTSWRCQGVQQD